MKLKIGDKVICSSGPFAGEVGRIIADAHTGIPGVEFSIRRDTHSCDGAGKKGYCWWAYKQHLIKYKPIQLENK